MENVTRVISSKQAAMEAVVRMDNSAVHFRNNKLSDDLSSTLNVLFRKKNSARIHQRNLASKTRKDYEYLLAIQEVAKREQKKESRGISTSATARRAIRTPTNDDQGAVKGETVTRKPVSKHTGTNKTYERSAHLQQKQKFKVESQAPSPDSSGSSSILSDVTSEEDSDEDDKKNNNTLRPGQLSKTGAPGSIFRGAIWQQSSNTMASKKTNNFRQTSRARRHDNKVWAVDTSTKDRSTASGSSHFRYTRGPSYNQTRKSGYVSHTKSLMQTAVYDPGDVYLTSRRRSVEQRAALKTRAKTALGVASTDVVRDDDIYPGGYRKSQSACLSRRRLREMNNIDALIETSETPVFFDRKKILIQNAKHEFQGLQRKVYRFLEDIDRFNKMSATAKDPVLFFLKS